LGAIFALSPLKSTKKKIALLAEKYNLSIKEENGLVLFEPTVINLQVIT
jgi:hypothetical protein